MKPLIFPFPCPKCRTTLQAEADNSGAPAACPVCQCSVTIPKAPARQIDGFLIVLGVGLILGIILNAIWAVTLMSLEAPAGLFVGIVLALQMMLSVGFFLRKAWVKWAYPFLLIASVVLDALAALESGPVLAIGRALIGSTVAGLIWRYFSKSKRVRETFVH